jgi:hypothetical protein
MLSFLFTGWLSTDNWPELRLTCQFIVGFSLYRLWLDHSEENTSVAQQWLNAKNIQNTSCDTGSIVVCIYCCNCLAIGLHVTIRIKEKKKWCFVPPSLWTAAQNRDVTFTNERVTMCGSITCRTGFVTRFYRCIIRFDQLAVASTVDFF